MSVTGIRRGEVYLVALGPTRGRKIKKTRPCVAVSPDELNAYMQMHIVAPLTTGSHSYPFRVSCRFQGEAGHVVLDQIRTVDRARLVKRLGGFPLRRSRDRSSWWERCSLLERTG